MVAWMIRFSERCRRVKMHHDELLNEEVVKAEICLFEIIQNESFGSATPVKISNINVFEDESGLIRVKTKLNFSEDVKSSEKPYKHIIVRKLIEENHIISRHCGVQVLLQTIRERFWIIGARRMVEDVISKCVVCKRYRVKSLETPFAPLPRDRLKISAAFEITGTNFAGPLYLKNGEKAWIVIFTCTVYRACHFELVQSLSTEDFLQALRRFVARRGRVSVIYSDNGANYVGANNQMKNLDWKDSLQHSSVQRITWKFNVPSSPWWGEWWERIVRMIKELLRKNLGKKTVDYEELVTLLCDCESTINSRPLTYVSDNTDELIPVTPSSFLQSIPTSEVPDIESS
ncbi:uncharacterized protein [Leptinotarsa decemlineata]|uniref:uncharacterized protein n=1 Tax=Leptinotarsa decemlineata TaxID=7539 RepID=UPI003D3093F4